MPEQDTRTVNQKRVDGLNGVGQLAQGLCLMTGGFADAMAIGTHFPPLAKEVANIADSQEIVGKGVDFLIQVGPYGALIAAGMPFVLQIMANHRMIDASRLVSQGVVPPEVLEAQAKAQVAKIQAEALREQQQAIREAKEAQAAYEEQLAQQRQA